jgi:hypothetical protein
MNWKMSLEINAGYVAYDNLVGHRFMSKNSRLAHIDHIHQLAWRPGKQTTEDRQIASCAEDGTLKIYAVHSDVN